MTTAGRGRLNPWRWTAGFLLAAGLIGVAAICTADSREIPSPPHVERIARPSQADSTAPQSNAPPPYNLGAGDHIEISFFRRYDMGTQEYILDVGDGLSIVVEEHPELTWDTIVRPDGMISAPSLGDVRARGISAEALREKLRVTYSVRVPRPVVTVFVRSAQAKLNEFFTTMMSGSGGATRSLTVRPDGTLSLPLLGEVAVAGWTVAELQKGLAERYQAIFRYIDISINVVSSLQQRIAVLGEVARPGVFPLAGELSVPQAVAMAGGFLESAQPRSVIIIRQSVGGGFTGLKIDIKHMMERGGKGANVLLRPLDLVVVSKSRIARVDKWVDQYLRKILPLNLGAGITFPISGN